MARRGRKRRLEMETEYWRLLQSGVGTVKACQMIGIGRKTGYRWRAVNGGLPPARAGELASAVAGLADDAGLPLMVDLRPDGVTIDSGKDQWEDEDGSSQLATGVDSLLLPPTCSDPRRRTDALIRARPRRTPLLPPIGRQGCGFGPPPMPMAAHVIMVKVSHTGNGRR